MAFGGEERLIAGIVRGKESAMLLYHYTSHRALPQILEQGLDRGEAPVSDRRAFKAVNLTTDPSPDGHGLDMGGHIVTAGESAQLAAHGIVMPVGTIYTEKRAIRIKLKLASSDRNLERWRSWSRKHCEPGYAEKLEKSAATSRKARTWWLYFGTIPPQNFVSVDILKPEV